MKMRNAVLTICLLMFATAVQAETIQVRLATILPKGLAQEVLLTRLAEDWRKASGGTVILKKAPGGQKDGEGGIVKKLESRYYQAAVLSATGLSEVDRDVQALQSMPLVFRDWDEVDYVRGKIQDRLEARLRTRGYVLLFWADAGWVNFFSVRKATTPEEFKKFKMFSWVGDATQVEIMKSLGYKPVALDTDYIHSGFASHMIEAAPLPPGFASGVQIPSVAPHVLAVNWAPVVGAAIIRQDVWEQIPADLRKAAAFMTKPWRRSPKDQTRTFTRQRPKNALNGKNSGRNWDRKYAVRSSPRTFMTKCSDC
jgi:TRAP-type C4-dicarboxylate transport system substrate-binding protein